MIHLGWPISKPNSDHLPVFSRSLTFGTAPVPNGIPQSSVFVVSELGTTSYLTCPSHFHPRLKVCCIHVQLNRPKIHVGTEWSANYINWRHLRNDPHSQLFFGVSHQHKLTITKQNTQSKFRHEASYILISTQVLHPSLFSLLSSVGIELRRQIYGPFHKLLRHTCKDSARWERTLPISG